MIDHYEQPRNVGKLDAKKKNVGTGLVGAPACGDVMKLQVNLQPYEFNQDIKKIKLFTNYAICSNPLREL